MRCFVAELFSLQNAAQNVAQVELTRRAVLAGAPAVAVAALGGSGARAAAQDNAGSARPAAANAPDRPWFPAQNPERVKEMVGVSHGNLKRVREFLAASPALAKAAWDWGFGDWETALGAASHVGNREIAAVLIEHGARPDIFTFAMLGQLDAVKAYVAANPGIQRTHGPHGITLLKHARAGGPQAAAVVEYLQQLGDADQGYAAAPLSEAERKIYLGAYQFGLGPEDFVEIGVSRDGLLTLKRGPNGAPRMLFSAGEHAFHPAGAPAVRVHFTVNAGRAESLRVLDPDVILEAKIRSA